MITSNKVYLGKAVAYLPICCMVIFVLLYCFAASKYPGGSPIDKNSIGFDWLHNYWCNLMSDFAINGAYNDARIWAIAAMYILSFGLAAFFILFAQFVAKGKWARVGIALFGSISMVFTSLIYTRYHDPFTIGAGGFGLFALALIFATIRHARLPYFKAIFLGVVVLVLANNFIYFSSVGLIALPLLQKISFAYFLIWIGYINVAMVRGRMGI